MQICCHLKEHQKGPYTRETQRLSLFESSCLLPSLSIRRGLTHSDVYCLHLRCRIAFSLVFWDTLKVQLLSSLFSGNNNVTKQQVDKFFFPTRDKQICVSILKDLGCLCSGSLANTDNLFMT